MINDKLDNIINSSDVFSVMDELSVAIIDFKKSKYEAKTYSQNNLNTKSYYDLASLTKPLTIGLIQFIKPNIVKGDLKLLLDHQSGIPSWGLLPRATWRDQINSYEINKSPTVYSDFGAIRAQLEFERVTSSSLYERCGEYWDEEILHWHDLSSESCLKTGMRNHKPIIGEVHDPNAWVINEKVSHAGLFGTIDGLSRTLLVLEDKFSFIDSFSKNLDKGGIDRFINAWDRVTSKSTTFAGNMCGDKTIGHLGFTGTSFWVDCEKGMGNIILSNATRDGWYQKNELNEVRRALGNYTWGLA